MNFELLKTRRKELGLTQQQLADLCGLSKTTIFNYENEVSEPTTENLNLLSEVLGVDKIELLENSTDIEEFYKHKSIDSAIESMEKNLIFLLEDNFEFTSWFSENLIVFLSAILGKDMIFSHVLDKIILYDSDEFSEMYFIEKDSFLLLIENIFSLVENTEKHFKNKSIKKNVHLELVRILSAEEKEFEKKAKNFELEQNNYFKIKKLLRKISNNFSVMDKSNIDIVSETLRELGELNAENKDLTTEDIEKIDSLTNDLNDKTIDIINKNIDIEKEKQQNKEGGSDE